MSRNNPRVALPIHIRKVVAAVEPVERRLLLAITATFSPLTGLLSVNGDTLANKIVISRSTTGTILVNNGTVVVAGSVPTFRNTTDIFVSASDGDDSVSLDETNGVLPHATINGGSGNDTLTGGSGADNLSGGSGNDSLSGEGGVDSLDGGDDNDILTGGAGNDSVTGGAGNDQLIWNAGDGSDTNEAGDGVDTIVANGDDTAESFTITPNGTRLRLDRVTPTASFLDINAAENLVLNCNGGADTVQGSTGLASLVALTIDGGADADSITGGDGADVILGGDGNDTITPGRGSDVVSGGNDDDTLVWNPGDASDTFDGQAGNDSLQFNGSNVNENIGVAANVSHVTLTRDVGAITMDLNSVEAINITPVGGADNITVGNLAGTYLPTVNVNLAASGGGSDAAADSVIVDGTNAPDVIVVTGAAGTANVLGLASQTTAFNGDPTMDRILVNSLGGADFVSGTTLQASSVIFTVDGGTENDSIIGSPGVDSLMGDVGNDTLDGIAGNDSLFGDAGNDLMFWNTGDGSDVDEGGTETDTVQVNGDVLAENYTVAGNGTRVALNRTNLTPFSLDIGTTETLLLKANGGNDTVTGGNGLAGLITLNIDGGDGADSLTGGDGNDDIVGGIGDDTITPGRGNDSAFGGNDHDIFVWNPGDASDILDGQGGNNTLQFNGSNVNENIAVSANGAHVSLTRDVGAISMDLTNVEAINLAALGGADTITVNDVSGTNLSAMRIDLGASGGGGDGAADTVNVNGLASGGGVTIRNADVADNVFVNTDAVGTANAIFDTTERLGALSVGSGGKAIIPADGTHVLGMTSLLLSGTGKLDVTNNSAILDYSPAGASPITTIRSELLSGFAGGAWNGAGIISSVAAGTNNAVGYAEANSLFTTFPATWRGQPIDSTSILLTHTLKGDFDLNRTVNFADLVRLAQNYGATGSTVVWTRGDSNYDSVVGFPDLVGLAQNYNLTLPGLVAANLTSPSRHKDGTSRDVVG